MGVIVPAGEAGRATVDGYDPKLIHACHNRTVVIDAHLGERENKQVNVVEAHGLRNVHLYEGDEPWINVRDAVRTVFAVLAKHIAPGQAAKVAGALPAEIRALWPASHGGQPEEA